MPVFCQNFYKEIDKIFDFDNNCEMSGTTALFVIFLYLVFLIAPILSVFNSTRKYDDKKRMMINAFFIAFFVPFINIVFYLIAGALDKYFPLIFVITGAIWYLVVVPFLFWWSVVLSGKGFAKRKFVLFALILTYVIGYVLFLIAVPAENMVSSNNDLAVLTDDYKQTIDYLKSYKQAYGVYPAVLGKEHVHATKLTDYTYQTLNNQTEFKLSLGEYIYYCSNYEVEDCRVNDSDTRIGDWVEKN